MERNPAGEPYLPAIVEGCDRYGWICQPMYDSAKKFSDTSIVSSRIVHAD
jgi:hypothetical protein